MFNIWGHQDSLKYDLISKNNMQWTHDIVLHQKSMLNEDQYLDVKHFFNFHIWSCNKVNEEKKTYIYKRINTVFQNVFTIALYITKTYEHLSSFLFNLRLA